MDLPNRKNIRLKGFDYSSPGAYFLTICAKDRKCIFSGIVGDGVLDVPENKLTQKGEIAEKYIKQLGETYKNIIIDKYVIMPNHIHLIVMITEGKSGTSGTPSPTNSLIPKFVSTFKRYCNKECNENIFQRSFHDHIIRDEDDYMKIGAYIDTNVAAWKKDCFYKKEPPKNESRTGFKSFKR